MPCELANCLFRDRGVFGESRSASLRDFGPPCRIGGLPLLLLGCREPEGLDLAELDPLHILEPAEVNSPATPGRSSIPDQHDLLVVVQPLHDPSGLISRRALCCRLFDWWCESELVTRPELDPELSENE